MKDWQYKKEIKKLKDMARKRGWKVNEVRIDGKSIVKSKKSIRNG